MVNEDALRLQQVSSAQFPYELVNPYAFEPPIAPHIAAQQIGVSIDIEKINECYQAIANQNDYLIVEGAGGWLVPINDRESMADIAISLNLPVILVAGIRLGCLNHTLLSIESILSSGCELTGWIANHLTEDISANQKNINALQQRITAPLLGSIPWQADIDPGNISKHIILSEQ